MWRLTIYQKYKHSYEHEGKEINCDGEYPVVFESNVLTDLFAIVEAMSHSYAVETTRYELRRVVD